MSLFANLYLSLLTRSTPNCPTVGSRATLATHTTACADLHRGNRRLRHELAHSKTAVLEGARELAEAFAPARRLQTRLHALRERQQSHETTQTTLQAELTQAQANLEAERTDRANDRERDRAQYQQRERLAAEERAQEVPELEERLANYEALQIRQLDLAHDAENERQRLVERIAELERRQEEPEGIVAGRQEESGILTLVASMEVSPVASGSDSGTATTATTTRRRTAATTAAGEDEDEGERDRPQRRAWIGNLGF